MGLTYRKRIWIIPGLLAVNVSRSGLSLTVKAGPLSVNSRTRRARVNLPGGLSYSSRRMGRRR